MKRQKTVVATAGKKMAPNFTFVGGLCFAWCCHCADPAAGRGVARKLPRDLVYPKPEH